MRRLAALAAVLWLICCLPLYAAAETTSETVYTGPTLDPTQTTIVGPEQPPTLPGEPTAPSAEENTWWENLQALFGELRTLIGGLLSFLNPLQVAATVAGWLFAQFGRFLLSTQTVLAESSFAAFFGHAFITESLDFFMWVAGILMAFGFLAQLGRILERAAHDELTPAAEVVFPILRAYGMLLLCKPAVLWLNALFLDITDRLSNVSGHAAESMFEVIAAGWEMTVANWLLTLGMVIITAMMLLRLCKRLVTIYIQIAAGYFYCFDLMRGSNVLGEWGRDVLAGYITFGIQMVIYKAGLVLLATGLYNSGNVFSLADGNMLVGCVLLLGVGVVPMALRRWGYANQQGSGGFGRAVGQAVNVGMSIAHLAL